MKKKRKLVFVNYRILSVYSCVYCQFNHHIVDHYECSSREMYAVYVIEQNNEVIGAENENGDI